MTHKHLIGAGILCLCSLAACQNENEMKVSETGLSLSVEARIGDAPRVEGRYVGDNLNSVTFASGDSIGIFMDDAPVVRWDYVSLSWVPEQKVYWPDRENEYTFRAYYPYAGALSYDEVPMPGLQEQDGTMEGVAKCDFLVATTTQGYGTDGVVNFKGEGKSFRHVSSLVYLQIKATDDLAGAVLKRITLTGANLVAPSKYSFTEGVKLLPDAASDSLTLEIHDEMDGSDRNYYLVLNEKQSASSEVVLEVEYEVGEKTYVAKKGNFSGNVFEGGMQYSFALAIRNNSLTVLGAQIGAWEPGNEMEDVIVNAEEKE